MLLKHLRRESLPLFSILFFALIWFAGIESIFTRFFLWDDNATFFLPLTLFNFETLRTEHVLPIINFFQMAGWNHLHAGQSGVLYPPAYAAAWIASVLLQSPLLTIDILCIGHLTAGMLGMYAWLRLLGARRGFAVGGAIFYLTLPFTTILSKSWVVVSYTHCFVPICFVLLESNLQRHTPGKTMAYIFAKTLYMLQGYPQYVVYVLLFELLYIVLRGKASWTWRTWASFIGANGIAVVLSLPLLLPMAEAAMLSAYRNIPFSLTIAVTKHLNLTDFIQDQLLLYRKSASGHINIFHIGGGIILPWIIYKTAESQKHVPRIIITLGLASLIALLLCTPLYATIGWLPIINHFRWPFKIFFFVGFFATAAMTLLIQWLHDKKMLLIKHVVCIGLFALYSHTIVLRSPPIGAQTMTDIHTPLTAYANSNFRMIGVSTPEINLQPSLYEHLPSFNYPSAWRIPALTGYDPIASRMHTTINTRMNNISNLFKPNDLPSLMDHLSRWSVRYIVSREPLTVGNHEQTGLKRVSSRSSMIVYENSGAFPVAAFESSLMQPVPIEYRANRIRIYTAGATGTLFLRIAPLEGYRKINPDGWQEQVTLAESGVLLSLQEPQEFVDILYRSKTFEWGLAAAAFGLFAAATLFIWQVTKPGRKAKICP